MSKPTCLNKVLAADLFSEQTSARHFFGVVVPVKAQLLIDIACAIRGNNDVDDCVIAVNDAIAVQALPHALGGSIFAFEDGCYWFDEALLDTSRAVASSVEAVIYPEDETVIFECTRKSGGMFSTLPVQISKLHDFLSVTHRVVYESWRYHEELYEQDCVH